jgi:hypothetical protein
MPLGLGPRFVVEAAFLIAVAIVAAMASLTTPAIIAVMAGAWLLVAAVEWGLSRRSAAPERAAHRAEAAPPPITEHSAPMPAREPEPEPEPLPEPVPPEPVGVAAAVEDELFDGDAPPLAEPVPPQAEERVELVAVPAPEPEPEPAPEPEPEPEPARAEVVRLDAYGGEPREWNLWELERAARDAAGEDAVRHEERSFLLMYLREYAGPDGSLPATFDALVRDSFGDLLGTRAR